MDFDVLVCIDCWWNLPNSVSLKIENSTIPHKIHCNSHDPVTRPTRGSLKHLPAQTNFKQFMKQHVALAKQQDRPARVLVAGQGWGCGTHYETIVLRNLSAFVPRWIRVFVDTEMLALRTQELDRTCTGEHVTADTEFHWEHVTGTLYEMKGVKRMEPWSLATHFVTKKRSS